jgi:hypothetical protein
VAGVVVQVRDSFVEPALLLLAILLELALRVRRKRDIFARLSDQISTLAFPPLPKTLRSTFEATP